MDTGENLEQQIESENIVNESDKIEALEKTTKQQAELIDKLIKQQELTNKFSQQLMKNANKQQAENLPPADPYEWVNEKIKNFQDVGCVSWPHFKDVKRINGGLTRKGLEFYLKFLKEGEKLSSEEVAKRIRNTLINIENK